MNDKELGILEKRLEDEESFEHHVRRLEKVSKYIIKPQRLSKIRFLGANCPQCGTKLSNKRFMVGAWSCGASWNEYFHCNNCDYEYAEHRVG